MSERVSPERRSFLPETPTSHHYLLRRSIKLHRYSGLFAPPADGSLKWFGPEAQHCSDESFLRANSLAIPEASMMAKIAKVPHRTSALWDPMPRSRKLPLNDLSPRGQN